jgi:uncharacterized membrane protein
MYDWLVFLHVLASMVWLGGITVLGAFAIRILREDDPAAVGGFLGSLRRIGPLVLAPAPVLLVGMGIWAVADSDAWDFGQLWVQLGLGLFAAAFLIGAAHQSRAALAAERAAAAGDSRTAAAHLRRWAWGMGAIVALLVVATWAMVFKPGL